MLKHFTAALAALFFLFPLSAVGESLDLSQLGAIEEAEHWEERAWYQREDGSDWRVQDDGSVIVTLSATGDVTIGGDTRKRGQSIFDKQLAQEPLGLDLPALQRQKHLRGRRPHARQFRGHADQHQERHEEHLFLRRAAPEYVQVLTSASVEAVSLENNHVMDHGKAGYQDTCDTLSAAGVAYSGHLGASTFTTETGVKIGMLAYQTFNGNYKNIYAAIEGDIKALRDAGCALVVVSYHWGEEKDYVPNERQVPLGRATIDAGADLVIGHHSHRMNPIEVYKGKYICYSLGNFSFAGNGRPDDMDTYIFQQRFRVYPDGTAENADMRIIPCSISSQENVNDFKPTPKDADGAAALLARLDKLNAQFEKAFAKTGVTAVSPYPTAWTYAY